MLKILSVMLVTMALLSACQPLNNVSVVTFKKGQFPERLSDWGIVFVDGEQLVINEGVVSYDLNTPLFTDYAHKLRTIWVPPGVSGSFDLESDINLPIGSVVTKTFFYPRQGDVLLRTNDESADFSAKGLDLTRVRLIETRIMVKLPEGWHGLPYVWDTAQQDAVLEITGASLQLDIGVGETAQRINYVVPDFNQCQGCHIEDLNSGEMRLLGVRARHMNKSYAHLDTVDNQLENLVNLGFIESLDGIGPEQLPRNEKWDDETVDLEQRARSYLDINCGHCHNPNGAADTSGLFLHKAESSLLRLGFCKPPVAAGQGTGGRLFGIQPGNADGSILTYRMQSLNLGAMMPELGRSSVHAEGVELIEGWINQLTGEC